MLVFDFLKSLVYTRSVKKVVKNMESRIKLPEVELSEPIEDGESLQSDTLGTLNFKH